MRDEIDLVARQAGGQLPQQCLGNRRHGGWPRVEADQQVLPCRQHREHARGLEGSAEAKPGHAMRTVALRVHAADGEVAAIELAESAQHIEQAGLAGAVGTDQTVDLAAVDREVDSVERDDVAEALAAAGNLDCRWA